MAHFIHLSYLQQLSELLEDKHKSQSARLGFIAKQITEKHVVHVKGSDAPKLKRCKSCHGPLTCDNVSEYKKKLVLECQLCGRVKSYSLSKPAKPLSQDGARQQSEPTITMVD